MQYLLLTIALLAVPATPGWTQSDNRFVSQKHQHFFEWFHQQSQVAQLYSNRSTLYIFGHRAEVHDTPCLKSNIIAELTMGQPVQNIAYSEDYLPADVINGYDDIWYHVRGQDYQGRPFSGYVWGADIARGWRKADITGDGHDEFVLLGIASRPRRQLTEINAELRVLQEDGRLLTQSIIPGLCVFEECATSPLLRIIKDNQHPELQIVEASTMTIGCAVAIEKSFFLWNGNRLQRVFHAEYTTGKEFANTDFSVPVRDQKGTVIAVKVCHFSHEDEHFNPVWECRVVPLEKQHEFIPANKSAKAQAR
jgi:hypothetical protein